MIPRSARTAQNFLTICVSSVLLFSSHKAVLRIPASGTYHMEVSVSFPGNFLDRTLFLASFMEAACGNKVVCSVCSCTSLLAKVSWSWALPDVPEASVLQGGARFRGVPVVHCWHQTLPLRDSVGPTRFLSQPNPRPSLPSTTSLLFGSCERDSPQLFTCFSLVRTCLLNRVDWTSFYHSTAVKPPVRCLVQQRCTRGAEVTPLCFVGNREATEVRR